ncbi:hypothetical protein F5Y18DRAFT_389989 [Xylariaceae sp. FL1019]|nr:hypothetical protein F5Y18DRAFT_389989 [Xylariaceae sp. FL1019]
MQMRGAPGQRDCRSGNGSASIIGDALEVVFGTACAIILNIIAEVVQDVTIPEGKALTMGWRVLIQGAKTFKDNELDSLDYQNWISDACGGGPWVDNVNQAFDFLGGVSDDIQEGLGDLRGK